MCINVLHSRIFFLFVFVELLIIGSCFSVFIMWFYHIIAVILFTLHSHKTKNENNQILNADQFECMAFCFYCSIFAFAELNPIKICFNMRWDRVSLCVCVCICADFYYKIKFNSNSVQCVLQCEVSVCMCVVSINFLFVHLVFTTFRFYI